jgi:DNA polymerase-3 subunit delta
VPAFKPAYLIHGDDHGRIAERRARLRGLAEGESGSSGVEVLEGDAATADSVALALSAMTFAIGRRFIVVDGVERWKDKGLESLEAALAAIAPDTTVAFFAREDSRAKAPARLAQAVRKAGGDVAAETTIKPWELPKWVIAQARELGLQLDSDAARALVQQVGDRQQRLQRELEKLELDLGPRGRVEVGEIQELTAPSAERKAWALADALVAGDARVATRVYLTLRAQGERVPGLLYWVANRLRAAHEVAAAVEAGEPAVQIKRRLRMPARAAEQLITDARRSGTARLRRAIEETADLELASRGGGPSAAAEDTELLLAIGRIAGEE